MENHTTENSHPKKPHKTYKYLDLAEDILFSSRWMVYPITFGLVIALVVYVYKFICETGHLLFSVFSLTEDELVVEALNLVDLGMVAFLILMIAQGSHQIFVRRFQIDDHAARPQWLEHIDSGILKVKISLSIAGITMIRLLKDFVDVDKIDWNAATHRMIIHGVCLVSAIVMALIWRLTHPVGQAGKH